MALEKFGALWKGKPGSKALFSGKLEDGRRILVFPNEHKSKESHPDFRIVVDTAEVVAPRKVEEDYQSPRPISDDDVPF